MNYLPCNFGKETQCEQGCYEVLNSEHLNACPKLKKKENIKTYNYENILNGKVNQKLEVLKIIEENNIKSIQKLRDSEDFNVFC